jgi:transcriptional regulator with XRE-family HTH domain
MLKVYKGRIDMQTIGEIIRAKRKERGWTQTELAEKSGYSLNTICRCERNERNSSLLFACDLADLFDCSLDELCGREVKQ